MARSCRRNWRHTSSAAARDRLPRMLRQLANLHQVAVAHVCIRQEKVEREYVALERLGAIRRVLIVQCDDDRAHRRLREHNDVRSAPRAQSPARSCRCTRSARGAGSERRARRTFCGAQTRLRQEECAPWGYTCRTHRIVWIAHSTASGTLRTQVADALHRFCVSCAAYRCTSSARPARGRAPAPCLCPCWCPITHIGIRSRDAPAPPVSRRAGRACLLALQRSHARPSARCASLPHAARVSARGRSARTAGAWALLRRVPRAPHASRACRCT